MNMHSNELVKCPYYHNFSNLLCMTPFLATMQIFFWREIQTWSDPNTLKMSHVSNTSLHYLAMESLFDYPSKNAHCIYVVFWWQNFLLPMHDSSLAAMQMGLAGNSKFTSLHFGISCWYPCKKKSRDLSIMLFSGGSTRTDWLSVGTLRCTFVQVLVITWTRLYTVTEITNYCRKIMK